MLTKEQIEQLRSEYTVETSDVRKLIEVIDAMRAQLENVADDYPSDEKPERNEYSDPYTYLADKMLWSISERARVFLARLDAGMPEETSEPTPNDNIGDIPF